MAKILLASNDTGVSGILKQALANQRFVVEAMEEGGQAEMAGKVNRYELLIVDMDLAGVSGWEVCRRLREHDARTPIIMLCPRDDARLRATGLDMGMDDVVVKPFDLAELLARVRAQLRRRFEQRSSVVSAGPLVLDQAVRKIRLRGAELDLTPLEFGALELFIRRPGQIISRAEFVESLWAETLDAMLSHRLENIISQLRRKLGCREFIRPHAGRGYELEADHLLASRP